MSSGETQEVSKNADKKIWELEAILKDRNTKEINLHVPIAELRCGMEQLMARDD